MKKTIIAFVALAGMAVGAELDVNSTVSSALTAYGYEAGDSFAITLTFNGSWSGLTTSDNHLSLSTQTNAGTQFVNIGGASNGWQSGWTFSEPSFATSDTTTLTLTVTSQDAPTHWITPTVEVNNSGDYVNKDGGIANNIKTFTIKYDSDSDVASFIATREFYANAGNGKYKGNYYVTSEYNVTGLTLNATKFNIKNGGVSSVVISVPEPTTATLSLLALAGLAARRRRK